MKDLLPYAPTILVVVAFLLQSRIFVTPLQLEKKHREILEDADKKYPSKESHNDLKDDVREMKQDIKDIKECVMNKGCQ